MPLLPYYTDRFDLSKTGGGTVTAAYAAGAALAVGRLGSALEAAGFRPTPRGLRLRG